MILLNVTDTSTSAPSLGCSKHEITRTDHNGDKETVYTYYTYSYESAYYWSTWGPDGGWPEEEYLHWSVGSGVVSPKSYSVSASGSYNDHYYTAWSGGYAAAYDVKTYSISESGSTLLATNYSKLSADITNYNYLECEVCGDVCGQPGGNIANSTSMWIGYDTDHRTALATRLINRSNPVGDGDWKWGPCIGGGTTSDTRVTNSGAHGCSKNWATITVNISDLTGTQTVKCFAGDDGYSNGGWVRIRKVRLYN